MISAVSVLVLLGILLALISLFPQTEKWPLLSLGLILLGAAMLIGHHL